MLGAMTDIPVYLWVVVPILLIVALGPLLLGKAKRSAQTPSYPYAARGPLLTKAERSFLGVLELALAERYRVALKVRLADIIKVRSGSSKSAWQSAFNRISAKHVDFVLCRADTFEVVCVLELDDKSHRRRERRERDAFVDAALRAADIPALHMPTKAAYTLAEVKDALTSGGLQLTPAGLEQA